MKRLPSLRRAGMLALAGALACVAAPWDVERFEREHPALGGSAPHRLGDATPYLLPADGRITFFLCRWPTEDPIPVSLPPDATDAERRGLELVMGAWEGAGLGVRFAAGAPAGVGIELRFVDPEAGAAAARHAATTVADCAVAPEALGAAHADVLPARLVFASIHMRRGGLDALGRSRPHAQDEFVGLALHDFGHALGYQGHAPAGGTIMVKERDVARWAARRVLAGSSFSDSTLRALYAVPSGSVIARSAPGGLRTEPVDRLARLAGERGFAGPFVRVGDVDGRLAWRDAGGTDYTLRIPDVPKLLREPRSLRVRATLAASLLLDAIPDAPGP